MQYLFKILQPSYKYCITGLLGLMISHTTLAQTEAKDTSGPFFGNHATGKWTIGLKVGNIDNNIENTDDADAVGVVVGYEFSKPIAGGKSSIELEYISGDVTDRQFGIGNYEAEMLNLFFTYRSPGALFFKIKGGLSYSNLDIDVDPNLVAFPNIGFQDIAFPDASSSNEDVSLAAGVGLGYKFSNIGDSNVNGLVEIEHISASGDDDLSFTGFNFIGQF